jgi:short-subunit dehydrogenase
LSITVLITGANRGIAMAPLDSYTYRDTKFIAVGRQSPDPLYAIYAEIIVNIGVYSSAGLLPIKLNL